MRKCFNKWMAGAAALVLMMSIGAATASANNWEDRQEEIYYSDLGGDIIATSRVKTDTTPMYCYNLPTSENAIDRCDAVGTTTMDAKFYWQSGAELCTATKNTSLAIGQKKYISSYVKERGYNYCNFQINPHSAKYSWIRIKWSPDSIGA